MRNHKCWICTGVGNSLCKSCNAARRDRMAKYNIDSDTAVSQLREMRLEDEAEEAGQRWHDSREGNGYPAGTIGAETR